MNKEFIVTFLDGEEDEFEYNFSSPSEFMEFKRDLAKSFMGKERFFHQHFGFYLDTSMVRNICFIDDVEEDEC